MYVCMHVCIYVCVWAHTDTYMHTCIRNACMALENVHTYIHTYMDR